MHRTAGRSQICVVTPDGPPIIALENVIAAAGHAMLGLSLAPITGKLVSQIACGEKPEINVPFPANQDKRP